MALHLHPVPGIGAAAPGQRAEGEEPRGETLEPRHRKRPVAQEHGNRAAAFPGRILEVDPAAPVAQHCVAAGLKAPPHRLVEHMGKRAHLGGEGHPPAPDLADGPAPHEHTLAGILPVRPPDLDRRPVPEPRGNVGLCDDARAQHAFRILRIDREIGTRAQFRRREAAFRLEAGSLKAECPVVVGEAEHLAVGAGDAPAPGKRGRALVEMGLQGRREGFHRQVPVMRSSRSAIQSAQSGGTCVTVSAGGRASRASA
ncbi:hypothetical protein SAMN05444279_12744 [Ruegeria intermedia]|uniref:Uncharacterized protein n=1 Tax=Ruegeria intermedia TaxID=996115 RepID=A0A1M5APR4_9RHOB|nr:hypothetical protein SAMN05444279_12744 [Ruegeria intermedia]